MIFFDYNSTSQQYCMLTKLFYNSTNTTMALSLQRLYLNVSGKMWKIYLRKRSETHKWCALTFLTVSIGERVFVCLCWMVVSTFFRCIHTVLGCVLYIYFGVGRVKILFIGGWNCTGKLFGENGKILATVDEIFLHYTKL